MKRVIVFGSLNMDLSVEAAYMPAPGETINGSNFIQTPGGKGANQCVAAAKLGAQVYMLGKVGDDENAAILKKSLMTSGVIPKLLTGTTTGTAVIVRAKGENCIILSPGANHEVETSPFVSILRNTARPGDIFIAQLECTHSVTFALLEEAKKQGLVTILNPAPASYVDDSVLKNVDYLILNQTECQLITGIYPTPDNYQEALLAFDSYNLVPIITLGKSGSVCRTNAHTIIEKGYHVTAIDSTAAGDTYIGAMAAMLAKGETIKAAMAFANKAAALTVTKVGAQEAIPILQDVIDFTEGTDYPQSQPTPSPHQAV